MPVQGPSPIEVGDWIRVPRLSPGIWRVSRTLLGFNEDRWSLSDPIVPSRRTLVFSHRMVNDSWNRSFSRLVCDATYVEPLEAAELSKVMALCATDNKLADAFEKYRSMSKPIDSVASLAFGGLSAEEIEQFPSQCKALFEDKIADGLTIFDVLSLLNTRNMDQSIRTYPLQVTLQLVPENFELRKNEFLYRRYTTLHW
jgi:hypothetical protein